MKFINLTAVLTAFAIGVSAFASPAGAQQAQPIVDTYAVNVNGNPDGFIAAAKKIFKKADALGIKSERNIYLSEIGGTNTNVVYVTLQYPNYAAMETGMAKIYATKEWTAFQKAMTDMGMATTGREVLRELYDD